MTALLRSFMCCSQQVSEGARVARVGFVMQLKPGFEAVYRQKHDDIWPEMIASLHSYGIRNYTIFRRGSTLFAYYECDDPSLVEQQRHDPVVQRWWQMMHPYMDYNADGTPWAEPIEEVFHMD
jgi:L-rhamnose mutarotase